MSVRVLHGDCRAVLATLPADSVHCVVTSPPYFGLRSYLPDGHPDKALEIGLEGTLAGYVAGMVEVFRAVRRVLRPDGTLWLNLGDSYAGSWGAQSHRVTDSADPSWHGNQIRNHPKRAKNTGSIRDAGLKPKDLMMVPARVALALQADGWWLRSDVIWDKPTPMPESCTDRPTSSHEHVFLLTKAASYFYDAHAIREDATGNAHPRGKGVHPKANDGLGIKQNSSFSAAVTQTVSHRNARNVWRVGSSPFPSAHFATMPAALAERCIKAGTSEAGCCPACGGPWERVVERGEPDLERQRAAGGDAGGGYAGQSRKGHAAAGVQDASAVKARVLAGMVQKRTVGWKPTCDCPEHQPIPCLVLDPFGGAGTTGLAADRLGRDAVLVELYDKFVAMAADRIHADAPLLGSIAAE